MDSSNNHTFLDESWMSLIAERLSAGQTVRYLKFRGVSMLPMLRQGQDAVELSPLPDHLQKYDLPVYRRDDGQYVMHRIVAVQGSCYICLGDNTLEPERIYPDQMIGIVSAFKRGGKRMETSAPSYQLYCRIWVFTHPVRKLLHKVKRRLRSAVGPLLK